MKEVILEKKKFNIEQSEYLQISDLIFEGFMKCTDPECISAVYSVIAKDSNHESHIFSLLTIYKDTNDRDIDFFEEINFREECSILTIRYIRRFQISPLFKDTNNGFFLYAKEEDKQYICWLTLQQAALMAYVYRYMIYHDIYDCKESFINHHLHSIIYKDDVIDISRSSDIYQNYQFFDNNEILHINDFQVDMIKFYSTSESSPDILIGPLPDLRFKKKSDHQIIDSLFDYLQEKENNHILIIDLNSLITIHSYNFELYMRPEGAFPITTHVFFGWEFVADGITDYLLYCDYNTYAGLGETIIAILRDKLSYTSRKKFINRVCEKI